jgi:hypothetical protein
MNTRSNQRCALLSVGFRVFAVTLVLTWLLSVSSLEGTARAQADELVQARYQQTVLMKKGSAPPVLVEEGTYLVDTTTGRYRVDRFKNGAYSVEIVDYKEMRRTVLNMDRKQAVVGSLSTSVPPGFAAGWDGRAVSSLDGVLPTTSDQRVDLGSRAIAGGLVVRGTRFTIAILDHGTRITHIFDRWAYFPRPGSVPIVLEERFESATEVQERRITDVTRVPVAEGLFAIPGDFDVRDLRPNGGRK